MSYIVTLCRPECFPTRLGLFEDLAQALAMARTHGATGIPEPDNHHGLCYPICGHEDDDNYAVWIERI